MLSCPSHILILCSTLWSSSFSDKPGGCRYDGPLDSTTSRRQTDGQPKTDVQSVEVLNTNRLAMQSIGKQNILERGNAVYHNNMDVIKIDSFYTVLTELSSVYAIVDCVHLYSESLCPCGRPSRNGSGNKMLDLEESFLAIECRLTS